MSDTSAIAGNGVEEDVRLYRAYREARAALPFSGRYTPYRWYTLPDKLSMVWMAYAQMLGEFSTELANTLNDLTNHVQRLQAWAIVIEGMDDDAKMAATHEFIDVLATNAVNLPYAIKSRFTFAAAHLCHQANMTRDFVSWQDDLPLDIEIDLNTSGIYGRGWGKTYIRFKRTVEAIGAKAFRDATGDFRNAYNHRFSPRFVIGMTGMVTRMRNEETGRFYYGFGGREPLALPDVIGLLTAECQLCYMAFEALQALVEEQIGAITAFDAAANSSS
ncbi:integrase [Novosphingobium sp. LASN5T]|nr:integrase [Novosphingobium sp. LASN5T]